MTKLDVVKQWIQKGRNDLLVARNALETLGAHCPYDTVCFHAQQAVEKHLKAMLSGLEREFPKTHRIGELVALLPAGKRPRISPAQQRKLSNYAVIVRYPAVGEEPLREDALEALKLAEAVADWVERMQRPSSRSKRRPIRNF